MQPKKCNKKTQFTKIKTQFTKSNRKTKLTKMQTCKKKIISEKCSWKNATKRTQLTNVHETNARKKHTSQNCSCKNVGSKIRCTNMLVEERPATKHIRCEKKKNELKNASQKKPLIKMQDETSKQQTIYVTKIFLKK